ncbi:hypothetical protein ALC62_10320 [Cyphomyrmex costatus]|uniref:Tyr recombinase domain-containing protein n=1 Tax=Cyphomyrmex costatus TaxID=456900 RepID=A0A151IE34_9HYME|nr:hypothetical protein ALC62_10320 [Cyphomyrmex costatus]
MFQDLQWWERSILNSFNPFRTQIYALEIFSDASMTGWGCFCNGTSAHGFWNEEEGKHHINWLELLFYSRFPDPEASVVDVFTVKPGSFQPDLYLPFFKLRPGLCVASCVLEYLEITKDLRDTNQGLDAHDTNNNRLLISSIKPFGPVSPQTIGHWIKSLLAKAGIDTDQFSAYSTRHAAVSSAFKRGVDISTIRRTAGWSAQSQTFMKYYNRPIQTSNDHFANSILK